MSTFSYVAVNKQGKELRGSIESDSQEKAAAELKKTGLTIASLVPTGALGRDINISFLEKKPTSRDLAVFSRQFVSIINAGVSVLTALEMLSDQTENRRLREAVADCKLSIEKGETFSAALGKHRDIFSDMYITMVEAGEASGSLDVSLTRMAEQEEKSAKLHATIKKASVYPIVVCIVAVGVIAAMLTFVIPTFQEMFSEIGGTMPGITLAIIAMSSFMRNYWYVVLAVILGLVFGIRAFKQTPAGKRFNSRAAIRLPLIKKLSVKSAAARMARTLSTLVAAGIPLIDAIEITADTMSNVLFKDALMDARDDVAMGSPLSASLKKCGLFPALVYHMVGIGEETGDLEGMLNRMATYYEEEVEQTTAQVMALLEPLIIVLLAAIVGTIIIAVILPMMNMYSALDSM